MSEPSSTSYSIHLRNATVEQAVALLTELGETGLVLGANPYWATVVLPRTDDERARLRRLADAHEPGVLLFNTSPEGDRILFHAEQLLVLDPARPSAFRDRGLISPAVATQMAVSTPRGSDWVPLLKLPPQATQSDALLRPDAAPYPGAIPVGAVRPPSAVVAPVRRPRTGQELYRMLQQTGAVELLSGARDLADEFALRTHLGAGPVIEWLLEQEQVVEVYLSDEGLQQVLDELQADFEANEA